MKCPHCGKEHSADAKFCEYTGKVLLKACQNKDCADYGKAILPMAAKFCPRCGKPLPGAQVEQHINTQETPEENHSNTSEQVKEEQHRNIPEPCEEIFTVKGVKFKMIKVEGGTFRMGATPEQGSDAYDDEEPVHSVTLSDYCIGETEVTQELWEAVMGSNPSYFKGNSQCHGLVYFKGNNQRPVESVSWDDCQEFIKELNRLTGKRFRLPTEAEWEYAARGGRHGKEYVYKYSGSNNPDEVAWYNRNSSEWTLPVKTKKANELGLYDMSGNVWEWCNDWYGAYQSNHQTNPKGPARVGAALFAAAVGAATVGACAFPFAAAALPSSVISATASALPSEFTTR